jgi:hypothetical protein
MVYPKTREQGLGEDWNCSICFSAWKIYGRQPARPFRRNRAACGCSIVWGDAGEIVDRTWCDGDKPWPDGYPTRSSRRTTKEMTMAEQAGPVKYPRNQRPVKGMNNVQVRELTKKPCEKWTPDECAEVQRYLKARTADGFLRLRRGDFVVVDGLVGKVSSRSKNRVVLDWVSWLRPVDLENPPALTGSLPTINVLPPTVLKGDEPPAKVVVGGTVTYEVSDGPSFDNCAMDLGPTC